jgi:hypothetical protein
MEGIAAVVAARIGRYGRFFSLEFGVVPAVEPTGCSVHR